MRVKTLLAAAAMLLGGLFSAAQATPVTYTLTGVVDGSVGATALSGATVTWTITSDTTAAFGSPPDVAMPAISDTIDISGFGTATLTAALAYTNNVFPGPGADAFVDSGLTQGIIFFSPVFDFTYYNGINSLGPIPVSIVGFGPVATDQGTFTITDDAGFTFQVTGVPEPITLALFGAGLAGLGLSRRRKKQMA